MIQDFHAGRPLNTTMAMQELSGYDAKRMANEFLTQVHKIAVGEGIPTTDVRIWFALWGRSGCSDYTWTEEVIKPAYDKDYETTPYLIMVGVDEMYAISDYGAREYPHLRYLLPNPTPIGDKAIQYFATHEATHMYDAFVNDGVMIWSHDENFEREYSRLIDTYIEE